MGKKIVADDVAVLHDESDALTFGDVGEGLARHRDDVGEFPAVIARTMSRAAPRPT
jgi:hypothetical protein